MPTIDQQKLDNFRKWVITSEIQLKDFNNPEKVHGQNNIRNCIDKLSKTITIYKESFSWWKHDIDPKELHKAERNFKKITALHSTLELEYNRK